MLKHIKALMLQSFWFVNEWQKWSVLIAEVWTFPNLAAWANWMAARVKRWSLLLLCDLDSISGLQLFVSMFIKDLFFYYIPEAFGSWKESSRGRVLLIAIFSHVQWCSCEIIFRVTVESSFWWVQQDYNFTTKVHQQLPYCWRWRFWHKEGKILLWTRFL